MVDEPHCNLKDAEMALKCTDAPFDFVSLKIHSTVIRGTTIADLNANGHVVRLQPSYFT